MNQTYFVGSLVNRILAFLIDSFFIGLMYAVLFALHFSEIVKGEGFVLSISECVIWVFLPSIYEGLFLGLFHRTPGKALLGLWVMGSGDDVYLTWKKVILRSLTNRLNLFLGLVPLAVGLLRYDRRTLADLFAETYVVQLRKNSTQQIHPWIFLAVFVLTWRWAWCFSSSVLRNAHITEDGQVRFASIIDLEEDISDYEDELTE